MRNRWLTGWVWLGILAAVAAPDCRAQESSVRFASEFDPQNFAHASFLGSGIYSVNGRQIYIVRFSAGIRIRSEEERRGWGMRLTLRTTAGLYDFKTSDSQNFDLPSSIGSASLLPGVEFRVPIFSNWRLDPFGELGPAMEFETDQVTWIYGLGVKSRAEFAASRGRFLLFNTLLWAGNWESDVSPRDDFVVIEAAAEWRHPIGWTMFGNPTELGPLVSGEFYVDRLRIDPPQGDGVDVVHRYEVGVIWGTVDRVKKWKLPLPRLGLSARFGDGGLGYRLIFSSRF